MGIFFRAGVGVLVLFFCGATGAQAEVVQQRTLSGTIATAEYRQGAPDRPAVLILHGFLQTRDFHTVRQLADALHDTHYSVLAPTLTLNIDARQESLPCDALHLHRMEDSVAELQMWTDWLQEQGHDDIVLVGHSLGSLQHIAFLEGYRGEAISQAILVSLAISTLGSIDPAAHETITANARRAMAAGDTGIADYRFSFCERYPSRADYFLSYDRWSNERIQETLRVITVPIHVIAGSADPRAQPGWNEHLREAGANLILIEGASHFFDGMYEFDLLETVESLLP